MEEPETAPVVLQPAPQIRPVANVVHGLVFDEVFEHRGRRMPVDPPELEESAIQPGSQQMLEVRGNHRPFRVAGQPTENATPHLDQRRRAPAGQIQPPEQLAARRLHRELQRAERFR